MFKRGIVLLVLFLIVPIVYANNGCCGETITGDSCVYTSEENCATLDYFNENGLCEETSFCGSGCCVSLNGCFEGSGEYTCALDFGEFFKDQLCGAIDSCQMVCCQYGSDFDYISQMECQDKIEIYGSENVLMNYVSSESDCQDLEDSQLIGCCVTDQGCTQITGAECGTQNFDSEGFGFYSNEYCSDVASYLKENDLDAKDYCECKAEASNKCDSEGFRIIEVDSCGNQGDVIEECNYPDEVCSTSSGSAQCVDVNCAETFSFPIDSVFGNFNSYDIYFENLDGVWDKNTLTLGESRKNTESWCIYEGPVGSFRDREGTQHYRSMCMNGEEIIEPCMSDRSEVCVAGYDSVNKIYSADCQSNNFEDYYSQDYNTGSGSEYYGVEKESVDENGVSTVTTETSEYCDYASITCQTMYGDAAAEGNEKGWELYINAFCLREDFSYIAADYCGSRGKCGLKQNIVGELGGSDSFDINRESSFNDIHGIGCGESCFNQGTKHGPNELADLLQCSNVASGCVFYDYSEIQTKYDEVLSKKIGIIDTFLTENMVPGWLDASNIIKYSAAKYTDCISITQRLESLAFGVGSNLDVDSVYSIGDSVSIDYSSCNDDVIEKQCKEEALDAISDTCASSFSDTVCAKWKECNVGIDNFCVSDCECDCENVFYNNPISWKDANWIQEFFDENGNLNAEKIPEDSCCKEYGYWDLEVDCLDKYYEVYGLCASNYDEACENAVKGAVIPELYNLFGSIKPWVIDDKTLLSSVSDYQESGWDYREFTLYDGDYGGCDTEGGGNEWEDCYGDEEAYKTIDIDYTCNEWIAPADGDCSLCDKLLSEGGLIFDKDGIVFEASYCNQFRCESLGKNCAFVGNNYGTGHDSCVSQVCDSLQPVNFIGADQQALEDSEIENYYSSSDVTTGYSVTEIPVGQTFSFGVLTDDYAQCRFVELSRMEDLLAALGGDSITNIYSYVEDEKVLYDMLPSYMTEETPVWGATVTCNEGEDCTESMSKEHNFIMSIPSSETEVIYYVWCKNYCDAVNINPYRISLKSAFAPPDNAPSIEGMYPNTGDIVPYTSTNVDLNLYLNRESSCRYSENSGDVYDSMINEAVCIGATEGSATQLGYYVCSFNIALPSSGTVSDYFLCQDIYGNTMTEPVEWYVSKSEALLISQTSPSGTIYTNDVVLQVNTQKGVDNGNAICKYEGSSLQEMFITGGSYHEQKLNLEKGDYSFDIICEDSIGNFNMTTLSFIIDKDITASEITGVYYLGNTVYVLTNEASNCEYGLENFVYGGGSDMGGTASTAHTFSVSDMSQTYYIKCVDAYGNEMDTVSIDLMYLL